jgi:hypothetical protein
MSFGSVLVSIGTTTRLDVHIRISGTLVSTHLDELKVVLGLSGRLGSLLRLGITRWDLRRLGDLGRAGHGVGVGVVGGGSGSDRSRSSSGSWCSSSL